MQHMQLPKHKTEMQNKASGVPTKQVPKTEAIAKIPNSKQLSWNKHFQTQTC